MAVVSVLSSIRVDDTATHLIQRTFSATAAVQDTAAGSSVVVTVTQDSGGASPPVVPDLLELSVRIDNGATIVRTFTLTPGSSSQTVTFFFTNDGTGTGAARAGFLRMRLRAANSTDANPANRYDVTTDIGAYGSAANTYPTGFGLGASDRQGYIRGTTTATTTLPGAGTLAYGDTLTGTTILGAVPFDSRTVSVALSPTLAAVTSAASTTATFTTALGSVDNRFPVASTSETSTTTFPNASLTTVPWTTAALTETTRAVDPRFTKVGLLQVNDNAWGTAPLTKDVPMHQRLTADLAFIAMRYRNANGVGVNGLTVSHTMQDTAALTTADSWSDSTAAEGGEAGWTNTLRTWSASLPGGSWKHTATVTAPPGATGLESGFDSLVLLARNPNYQVISGVSLATAGAEGDHAHPGDSLVVSLVVLNVATDKKITPDAGTPVMSLVRYNPSTNVLEALNSSGTSWAAWTTGALPTIALTANPNDANLFQATISTAGWGLTDIVAAQVQCLINGTPYGADAPRELVGTWNPHNAEDRVNPADITLIANATWDTLTADARAAASYGALVRANLDALISSRATHAEATTDTSGTTTLLGRLTAARASYLDALTLLDAAVSSRVATADARLGDLDATISSRAKPSDLAVTVITPSGSVA